jgi:hypothetical protein
MLIARITPTYSENIEVPSIISHFFRQCSYRKDATSTWVVIMLICYIDVLGVYRGTCHRRVFDEMVPTISGLIG